MYCFARLILNHLQPIYGRKWSKIWCLIALWGCCTLVDLLLMFYRWMQSGCKESYCIERDSLISFLGGGRGQLQIFFELRDMASL